LTQERAKTMTEAQGYFSILQYCPDTTRQESANVGVVLVVPGIGAMDTMISPSAKRVRQVFGRNLDPKMVQFQVRNIQRAIKAALSVRSSPEVLDEIAARQINDVRLTAPQRVIIKENVEQELQRLFNRLVEPGKRSQRRRTGIAKLIQQRIREANLQDRVEERPEVNLKGIELEPFAFDYGYRNDAYHVVETHSFTDAKTSKAIQMYALRILGVGNVLQRHEDRDRGKLQLDVVTEFTSEQRVDSKKVKKLLGEANVRVYDTSDLNKLIDYMQNHAKHLN
jgi:hypothetical protein